MEPLCYNYLMIIENEKTHDFVDRLLEQKLVSGHFLALKEHHRESAEHCFRVGLLAVDLGYENHFLEDELNLLGLAGLLHDLGKCDIVDEILSKESNLDEDERRSIERHPRLGFIKLDTPEFEKVRKMIVGHHEYKLSPYPRSGIDRREDKRKDSERRKKDETTMQLTEVLAVADIFDALASHRSYKKPFSRDEIKKIMSKQFTGNQRYVEQVLRRYEDSR